MNKPDSLAVLKGVAFIMFLIASGSLAMNAPTADEVIAESKRKQFVKEQLEPDCPCCTIQQPASVVINGGVR